MTRWSHEDVEHLYRRAEVAEKKAEAFRLALVKVQDDMAALIDNYQRAIGVIASERDERLNETLHQTCEACGKQYLDPSKPMVKQPPLRGVFCNHCAILNIQNGMLSRAR